MVAFNALIMKYIFFILTIIFSYSLLANQYHGTNWINQSNCKGLTTYAPLAKKDLFILDNGNIAFPRNEYGIMFFGKVYSNGIVKFSSDIGEIKGKIKNNRLEMKFRENSDNNIYRKLSKCKFIFVKDSNNNFKKQIKENDNNLESQITETKPKKINSSTGISKGSQEDLIVNVGDRVFFGYDSADLDSDALELLQDQAAWLNQNRDVSVTIEGHTDERSTFNFSLAIGERRAQAVKNYLIGLGIDPQRISTVSYGKSRPAVIGSNDGAWAQNRRAVTIVN